MSFIPIDRSGRQAYKHDTRTWRAKLSMWFWKRFSKKVVGENFYAQLITGEKTVYRNCNFKLCQFDGLKLVFILDSYIEHDTPMPEFHNCHKIEVNKCVFRKVAPIVKR